LCPESGSFLFDDGLSYTTGKSLKYSFAGKFDIQSLISYRIFLLLNLDRIVIVITIIITIRSLSSLFGDFFHGFLGHFWNILGHFLGHFGTFLEDFWRIFGKVSGNFGNILGTFGNILGTFGNILGTFWEIFGKKLDNFGKFGKTRENQGKPRKTKENQGNQGRRYLTDYLAT